MIGLIFSKTKIRISSAAVVIGASKLNTKTEYRFFMTNSRLLVLVATLNI